MTADRWAAVGALFADLLPLDARARAERLGTLADADLAREVASLLDAHADATHTALPALPFPPGPDDADDDALGPGGHVGPYVLVEEVGRGGMGTVYRARRADGVFDRTVALKVVSRGRDTDRVLRRFARERAVLAGLAHPNVARLYDGGTAPDGRPYFAMEFVAGAPITAYADAHGLGLGDRLRLFLQVCEAVAYAHQNLVVHRDLKPSNIFVTEAGGAPQVKLLDFGLARLLAPRPDDDAAALTLSDDGLRAATPAYAAPEQLAGGAVTTQTDVYALGATLYELLTGTRARPGRTDGAPRPSAAALTPEAAAARGLPPERLRRCLRGDLDAVVERALRPDPAGRYGSADALADDLRRHLAGLPVRARRGTRRYRAGRFVRRHRAGVAVAAAFAAVLAAGGSALVVQERRASDERDKAAATAAFLEDLFLEVDVGGGRGSALTVRDALDEGARRIGDLDDQPEVQAHMLDVLARVYRSLALFGRADTLHGRAVAVYTRALGPDHPETLAARHHRAYFLFSAGRYGEADTLYRAVLDARRRRGDPVDLYESLGDYAALLNQQNRLDEAERLTREAIALLDANGERLGYATADVSEAQAGLLNSLGNNALGRRRFADAAASFERARATYTGIYGPDQVYVAVTETGLARALAGLGRHAEAAALVRRAEGVLRRLEGPAHPWVASALGARARVAAAAGRWAEADSAAAAAVAIHRATHGPDASPTRRAVALADTLRLRRVPR